MDISVFIDGERFNYRVAGFITCGDYVLLQKSDSCAFWNMLGGRVHIGESSQDAFIREMKEELNLDIGENDLKFIYMAENFFDWQNYKVQELLMVYKLELPEEYLEKFDGFSVIDGQNEKTKWFKKQDIKDVVCLPELIYDLAADDSTFKHIVSRG